VAGVKSLLSLTPPVCGFFDEAMATNVRDKFGEADVILGANVICHVENLRSLVAGVKSLLSLTGLFIFEEPYLGDILARTSYDQIYDEHVYYYSVQSLSFLFSLFDLEIVDVFPQDVHGGSMRYAVGHKGAHEVQPAVARQREEEKKMGLATREAYQTFSRNVDASRQALLTFIAQLKKEGRRIVGYGATSKSTTVLNFCGLGPQHIDFISDTTPGKQGKFSPGVHIPIKPYSEFQKHYPDYALLFAWNHAGEILSKENDFMAQGGRFFTYVPEVRTLN
jgi:methylation protein EvaC